MTRRTLEELSAAYALGMLDQVEADRFEALLRVDPDARQEAALFIDAAAAFAAGSSPQVEPSNQLRTRILAAVAATPQSHREPIQTPVPSGYAFVQNGSEGWVDTDFPGFRTKSLSRGPHPGCEVMLIALTPGAKVPDHDHVGTEEIYILSGHLNTEGQVIGPGDFVRAAAGTHHHEVVSPDGCVALMILGPAFG